MLAPVLNRQKKMILKMLVEKQELKLLETWVKFRRLSIRHKSLTSPMGFFYKY